MSDARRWVAEVEAAYTDGGYAAGDNPAPPLDEMQSLLDRHDHLERVLRKMVAIVGGWTDADADGPWVEGFLYLADLDGDDADLIRSLWASTGR